MGLVNNLHVFLGKCIEPLVEDTASVLLLGEVLVFVLVLPLVEVLVVALVEVWMEPLRCCWRWSCCWNSWCWRRC